MNKKQKSYRDKYKSDKGLVQAFIGKDMKRDFKVACARKGVTTKETIMKFVAEFIRMSDK